MTKKKLLPCLLFSLLTGLFTLYNYTTLDPDFGWHLRMGQVILTSGIPKTDPFSYTMPSYPFIDHEWLTNILLFVFYNLIGKLGLAVVFAILTVASFIIAIPEYYFSFILLPLLLASTLLLSSIGIRPQIESWFLLAILFKILNSQKLWQKWRFFLPILLAVWVNLHGGFAIGIATLLCFIAVSAITERRLKLTNLIIIISSILATFINPYGPNIWHEVWMQMTDSNLRWTILEWQPLLFKIDFAFLLLLALSLILIVRYRNKFSVFEKVLYYGLLLAGLSSQRQIFFWLIVATSVISKSLKFISQEFNKTALSKSRSLKIYQIATFFAVSFFSFTFIFIYFFQSQAVVMEDSYPKKAIQFLKTLSPAYELFAPYEWGGYLIWNLPQKKVFIDGRMPSWRWNSPNSSESNWAFKDYNDLLYNNRLDPLTSKYNIRYILWHSPDQESDWKTSLLGKLGFPKSQSAFNHQSGMLINMLESLGWKKIYSDSNSIIYRKF